MTFDGNWVGRELDRQAKERRLKRLDAKVRTWNENRRTHHWVTLDGQEYSCNDCDTKTGDEPCPGLGDPGEAATHPYEAVTGNQEQVPRRAVVYGKDISVERIEPYLPGNYKVVGNGKDIDGREYVMIEGEDNAGWTLDDYVLPRLASGLWFGEEIESRKETR